jgi:thiol-disulfide isomerase/thioredoxin
MLKKFIIILSILSIIPVYAGELEDALKQNKNIFLYMYTPECGYCNKFAPRYNKISKMYDKHYTFVKLNANTQYGYSILRRFKGRGVPYIVLINSKNKASAVDYYCLMQTEYTDKVLMKFIK